MGSLPSRQPHFSAAEALHTRSRNQQAIQLLEAELGFEIFSRKRNRIVG